MDYQWHCAASSMRCLLVMLFTVTGITYGGNLYNSHTFEVYQPRFLLPKPTICSNVWWTGVYTMNIYQKSPLLTQYYGNHDCDLHIVISEEDYFITNITVLAADLLAGDDGECVDFVQLFSDNDLSKPLTPRLCQGSTLPDPILIYTSHFMIYTHTGPSRQPLAGWHIVYNNLYDYTQQNKDGSASLNAATMTNGQSTMHPNIDLGKLLFLMWLFHLYTKDQKG